jgi:hypothetical protein
MFVEVGEIAEKAMQFHPEYPCQMLVCYIN